MAVYGGFTGTETARDQRDWAANETILSGDIGHDRPAPGEPSYHVVSTYTPNSPITGTAVLDGFSITGGMADGSLSRTGDFYMRGGGIYNPSGQPTLRNLVIHDNSAREGGGMYNEGFAHLMNVLFRNNDAEFGGGLANGGRSVPVGEAPTASGQDVQDPIPYVEQAILANVTFTGNTADFGGAISNCGARSLYQPPERTQPDLVHVTMVGNIAWQQGSAVYSAFSQQVMSNSIVWNNSPDPFSTSDSPGDESSFSISHSILQAGCPAGAACSAVIDADPLLGALGSAAGGPPAFPLSPNSPAIDAALPDDCTYMPFTGAAASERLPLLTDQRGAPRPAGRRCDLGAYEYQPEPANVELSGLNDIYDGQPHAAAVATNPPGLNVSVTYDGQPEPPVNAGSYTVYAEIDDPRYSGAASGTLTIAKAATQASLAAAPNPAPAGQPVTLTAAITPTGHLPAGVILHGSVIFTITGRPPVSIPPGADGMAVYTLPALAPGEYTIAIQYSGDENFAGSAGGPLQLVVEWYTLFFPRVGR